LNFKIIFFISFLLSSCGVKAPPQPDDNNITPSIVDITKKKLLLNVEQDEDKNSKKKKTK
jgi:hypothetical protein